MNIKEAPSIWINVVQWIPCFKTSVMRDHLSYKTTLAGMWTYISIYCTFYKRPLIIRSYKNTFMGHGLVIKHWFHCMYLHRRKILMLNAYMLIRFISVMSCQQIQQCLYYNIIFVEDATTSIIIVCQSWTKMMLYVHWKLRWDHPMGPQKVVLYDRWSFIRGTNV